MLYKPLFYAVVALVIGASVLLLLPTKKIQNSALHIVEWLVHLSAPVPEISPSELAAQMASHSDDILLLDVREEAEYNESHLKGALHLPPAISPEDFVNRYSAAFKGKNLVVYCSVGKRSSDALLRVESLAKASGAKQCYNLRGGIFRWFNKGGDIVNTQGTATSVHPFDNVWGLFLARHQ
jgi:rhodanese-related sulfurtransferase